MHAQILTTIVHFTAISLSDDEFFLLRFFLSFRSNKNWHKQDSCLLKYLFRVTVLKNFVQKIFSHRSCLRGQNKAIDLCTLQIVISNHMISHNCLVTVHAHRVNPWTCWLNPLLIFLSRVWLFIQKHFLVTNQTPK